jgi:ATP-dependent RNA helicase DeaD
MDTMFINLGSADGFDPGKMLRYVCDTAGINGSIIGRIDIKGVYSFVDIDREKLPAVMTAFDGEVFRGRKVRTDISQGPSGSKGKKGDGFKHGSGRGSSEKSGYFGKKQQRDSGKFGGDSANKGSGRKKRW